MMGFGLFLFLVVVVMEMAPSSVLGELRVGRALEEGAGPGAVSVSVACQLLQTVLLPGASGSRVQGRP